MYDRNGTYLSRSVQREEGTVFKEYRICEVEDEMRGFALGMSYRGRTLVFKRQDLIGKCEGGNQA